MRLKFRKRKHARLFRQMLHANVLPVNRNGHGRLAAVTDRLAKTVFDCVRFNNLTNSLAAQVTTAPATTGKIGLAHLSPFASSAMIASATFIALLATSDGLSSYPSNRVKAAAVKYSRTLNPPSAPTGNAGSVALLMAGLSSFAPVPLLCRAACHTQHQAADSA